MSDVFTEALNAPAGRLAEVLLKKFVKREFPPYNLGIPLCPKAGPARRENLNFKTVPLKLSLPAGKLRYGAAQPRISITSIPASTTTPGGLYFDRRMRSTSCRESAPSGTSVALSPGLATLRKSKCRFLAVSLFA